MLYLRLEDHKIILADYSRPASCDAGTNPVLTLVEHAQNPTLSLRQNLQEARQQHPLFLQAAEVEVVVNGPTTLMPVAEYDDSMEELVFKSCFRVASEVPFRVWADVIPQLRTMLLFGVRQTVAESIEDEYRGVGIHYTSAASLLLRRFAQHDFGTLHRRVYVNCRSRLGKRRIQGLHAVDAPHLGANDIIELIVVHPLIADAVAVQTDVPVGLHEAGVYL